MGSKPSRVKGTLVATTGNQKVCQAPQQERTASAPPTPEHPDGGPRSDSPLDFSKVPDAEKQGGSQSHSDAWMPGSQASPAPKTDAAPRKEESPAMPLPGCVDEEEAVDAPAAPAGAGASAGASSGPVATRKAVAGGEEDGLSFDRPLEEVLVLATEAFGQIAASLPSPKWDRRVQALKGVGSVLRGVGLKADPQRGNCRGLQLRDGPRCFRAACLVLHIAMRDKVLPVLQAAHELYRLAFEHGQDVPQAEKHFAMATLLPHLLAKLGDLNIRLHESAVAAVVFSAGQSFFGVTVTLLRLQNHLEETTARGPQRMRVHAGVLDVVTQLVRQFPGRRQCEGDESDSISTWTPQDLRPFLVGGAAVDGVTGSRVQQAAAGLAVAICETLGRAAVTPLLEGMPAAAKELLVSRLEDEAFEDGDGEGDDDEEGGTELPGMDGLCIMGVGLRPSAVQGGVAAKVLTSDNEETIMDGILEDAGLVFEGQGLKAKPKTGSVLDEELQTLGLVG